MSGIYIPGMEMPKKQTTFTIFPNGYVAIYDAKDSFIGETKAVPVPDHGDLIERDKLREVMFIGEQYLYSWDEIEDAIDYAPTIIPADPADKEGEG